MNTESRFADLHLHSTASDGSERPSEVVRRAVAHGFSAMALADHDTMDGVPEAAAAAALAGIEFITGVEYSTLDGEREIHMLGYGVDSEDAALQQSLARLRAGRFDRGQGMVEKLNELGLVISWARVQEIAGDENVGRPHIARAMKEAGYIAEIKDAFTKDYIANGGRAYVERVIISPEEAIGQIRAAGGVAVLAHPGRFRGDDDQIADTVIERYIAAGLQGIEVFYSKHTPALTEHFHALAQRHGLVMTGGSDCHGENGDESFMGRVRLGWEHVTALKDAIVEARAARV